MKKSLRKITILLLLLVLSLGLFSGCNQTPDQSYLVYDVYFATPSFKQKTLTSIDPNDTGIRHQYLVQISSSCKVSLYQYTAQVTLYSSENQPLHTATVEKTKKIRANKTFTFDVEVSSEVQTQTAYVEVNFLGYSYQNPDEIYLPSEDMVQVTLCYQGFYQEQPYYVIKGTPMSTPTPPSPENYVFCGWYTSAAYTTLYDFSQPVNQPFKLYAKYQLDAVKITNKISTSTIKGVVKIYSKYYNTFLGFETDSTTSQGSGFCFYARDGYYYVLTNCHVVAPNSNYSNQSITVQDYQGNSYQGYIFKGSGKHSKAIDPAYDLACVYFKATSTNVAPIKIVSTNPPMGADVIALGAPQGQTNTITYGKFSNYANITLDASPHESNVQFDVMYHTASTNSGSSGGPLLNANLQVVGVHYASNKSLNRHYAIPAEKVQEFLDIYVYE